MCSSDLKALDPADIRFRMFMHMRDLQTSQLARMTQIDYDREMAFIAARPGEDGSEETLGVVRAVADPDNHDAEFAIIIRSDLKGMGLGQMLMSKLIDYFRRRGTKRIVGEALPDNHALLELVRGFGFEARYEPQQETVEITLNLEGRPVE